MNKMTTISFNETAKCRVTGNYALVLNSGLSSSTNSATVDKFNDYPERVHRGWNYLHRLGDEQPAVAGHRHRDGLLGSADHCSTAQGLLSNIVDNQVNLTYTKNLSPNLALTASVGVVGVRNGSFSLDPATGFEPIYSRASVLDGDAEAQPDGLSFAHRFASDVGHRQPAGHGKRQSGPEPTRSRRKWAFPRASSLRARAALMAPPRA